jgi:SAM-dependent methyltransferase
MLVGSRSKYACPLTHSPLRKDRDRWTATVGDAAYPLVAEIPQFLRFEPAESGEATQRLERLNRLAREEGWEPALRAAYADNPGLVHYVTARDRASFVDLLPLTRESDVLEIGPGLGQITVPLARRARSVWGLEVVAGQAEFAAERCRQEGLTNVHLATGGDDCRLPYGDAEFDVVVLNLVFEWCASRCVDEPFVEVQRRLLGEMFRVLRPGGSLYLATKNRFALRFLIGKPDEHCYNLRFGSALPRWLARLLMKRKGHHRPAGLLHSYRRLVAMLRAAGFANIAAYWAAPEMRHPSRYVPTDAASIRKARRDAGFVQGVSRSTRLLMRCIPAALVKHFTEGLAMLATKPR